MQSTPPKLFESVSNIASDLLYKPYFTQPGMPNTRIRFRVWAVHPIEISTAVLHRIVSKPRCWRKPCVLFAKTGERASRLYFSLDENNFISFDSVLKDENARSPDPLDSRLSRLCGAPLVRTVPFVYLLARLCASLLCHKS